VWVSRNIFVAITVVRRGDLDREVAFLECISNPRIIKLLGVCVLDDSDERMIVTEWMSNGSLSECMKVQRAAGAVISRDRRLDWSVYCLQAIEHMHRLTPTVLHGDIKGASFLLDDSFNVKLGTSRGGATRALRSHSHRGALTRALRRAIRETELLVSLLLSLTGCRP
jgi:hypothetical protein